MANTAPSYAPPVITQGEDARVAFMMKVYQHIGLALAAFMGMEFLLFTSGVAETFYDWFAGGGGGRWLLFLGGFMVGSWIATQATVDLSNPGRQYAGLFGMAALYSLLFAPFLYYVFNVQDSGSDVWAAAVITGIGFAGLSAVAWFTRKDLSFIRPLIMWGGVAALVLAVLVGGRGLAPLLGFSMAGFAAGSAVRQLVLATRRQGWRGLVGRVNGGMVVHLGVIALAVGFVASSAYLRQGEFEMELGQTVRLGDTTIEYVDAAEIEHDNRIEEQVSVVVDGQLLTPSLERFIISGQLVPQPGTRTTLTEDVQVALLSPPEDGDTSIVIRATRQPLILWLWLGGLMMLVGTVLSAFPGKRQRKPTDATSALIPVDAP